MPAVKSARKPLPNMSVSFSSDLNCRFAAPAKSTAHRRLASSFFVSVAFAIFSASIAATTPSPPRLFFPHPVAPRLWSPGCFTIFWFAPSSLHFHCWLSGDGGIHNLPKVVGAQPLKLFPLWDVQGWMVFRNRDKYGGHFPGSESQIQHTSNGDTGASQRVGIYPPATMQR